MSIIMLDPVIKQIMVFQSIIWATLVDNTPHDTNSSMPSIIFLVKHKTYINYNKNRYREPQDETTYSKKHTSKDIPPLRHA